MRSPTKLLIWIGPLWIFVFLMIISGSEVAKSRTVSERQRSEATFTPTIKLSSTLTVTLTSTPTLTLTPTPTIIITSTPTYTLTSAPTPTPIEIVLEEPDISPPYDGLCDTYWYRITSVRGHYAYLTLNVNDPNYATNRGEWRPNIPQTGFYRVEAYIPSHSPLVWDCPPNPPRLISADTSDARYTIQHAYGQIIITGTQSAYSNEWLPLGEYLFNSGTDSFIKLTDLNSEENLTTTVSFSAMRFAWQRPPLTPLFLPITGKLASAVITSTVGIQNAPAFDQCHLPNPSQMQTWWNYSPYRITNVYIGGGLLFHECNVPDKNWIEIVRNQGWGMIPTWVGPQAPCSDYRLRMSADPAIAFQEGQAEADAASVVASEIGLTTEGMGGTIIYYDLEAYSYANTACRETVKAFIAGWTDRLHYWGNRSGAYGLACSSYVSDWAEAIYPPENLWAYAWYANHFKENVPLFGISCVADPLWSDHQRIRQYAYGHNETYGGVTFNIDSNLADAEVVISPQITQALSSATSNNNNTPELSDYMGLQNSPTQGWLIVNGILYRNTHNDDIWQLVHQPRPDMAIRKAFFLDEQQGWLLVEEEGKYFQLFSTSDGGQTWQEMAPHDIEPSWYTLSLEFSDSQAGWIVIKQLTKSNFSIGRLLQTTDGGKTWGTFDLPIGEAAHFISPDVGWVAGGVGGNELYSTRDSGQTWKPVMIYLPDWERITVSLPAFSDPQNGILPVVIYSQYGTRLITLATHDAGVTWDYLDSYPNLPEGFVSVRFNTPMTAWSTTATGTCQITSGEKVCSLQKKLWRTQDGGHTWNEIKVP